MKHKAVNNGLNADNVENLKTCAVANEGEKDGKRLRNSEIEAGVSSSLRF